MDEEKTLAERIGTILDQLSDQCKEQILAYGEGMVYASQQAGT